MLFVEFQEESEAVSTSAVSIANSLRSQPAKKNQILSVHEGKKPLNCNICHEKSTQIENLSQFVEEEMPFP